MPLRLRVLVLKAFYRHKDFYIKKLMMQRDEKYKLQLHIEDSERKEKKFSS